jgi:hypothetical protein
MVCPVQAGRIMTWLAVRGGRVEAWAIQQEIKEQTAWAAIFSPYSLSHQHMAPSTRPTSRPLLAEPASNADRSRQLIRTRKVFFLTRKVTQEKAWAWREVFHKEEQKRKLI